MAILRDETAFSLGDLEQIHAHSGKADGLGGRGTLVGDRQFFERVEINGAGDPG